MQKQQVEMLNDAANPLKRLASISDPNGYARLAAFCNPEGLVQSLLDAHGDVAYHLVEEKGYILGYVPEKGFKFVRTESGFGFKAGNSVVEQLDLLGLFIYTFLLACSSKVAPCNLEDKVILRSIDLNHDGAKTALFSNDLAVKALALTAYDGDGKALAKQFTALEGLGTPVEYLNAFLPWLVETSQGLILPGTANTLSVLVPSHIYKDLTDEARRGAICVDYLPKAPSAMVDKATVGVFLSLFANIVNTTANDYIKILPGENNNLTVIFDGTTQYSIEDDGVYREDLKVQNMLVQEENHQYSDLGYFNSHASFLYVLMNNLKVLRTLKNESIGAVSPVGTWEKRYMQKSLPLDREFEQGTALEGVRCYYNAFVSQAVKCSAGVIMSIWQETTEQGINYAYKWNSVGLGGKVNKHEIAALALDKYNLSLSSKSMSWMNLDHLGFKIGDLPVSLRRTTLITLLLDASGKTNVREAINVLYKTNLPEGRVEAALHLLEEDTFVSAYEKVNKIDSRAKLGLATSPNWLVGGVQSSWVYVEQNRQGFGIDIVLRQPCILGNTIVDEPGVVKKLKELGTFFEQFTFGDTIENYSKDHVEFQYEATSVAVHPSGKQTYQFLDETVYVLQNGYETVELKDYATYDDLGNFVSNAALRGIFVQEGQSVLNVGYTNSYIQETIEGSYLYKTITVPCDCIVQSVQLKVNAHGSLEVKGLGLRPDDKFKARGPMKAMCSYAITGSHYLYNELNNGLPEGVAVVLTADSLKHKDCLTKELPYVFPTLVGNGLGHMIADVNERLGYGRVETTMMSWVNASVSEYESLRTFFWERYGQTRWVYRRDVADGMHKVNTQSYINMAVLPEKFDKKNGDYWVLRDVAFLVANGIVPEGKFSTEATVVTACTSGNPFVITDYDDIMVFDVDDTPNVPLAFWQRGYVAGPIVNEQGVVEHVYCEMKPELSTLRTNSSTTKLMQGIARVMSFDNGITPACYDLSAALLSDYKERVDRYSALMAITAGLDFTIGGEEVPIVKVFNDDGSVSLQFRSLIDEQLQVAIARQEVTVKDLHRSFNRVVLDLAGYKVFLPAIAEQDMVGNSLDGASGLLLDLMKDILVLTPLANCNQRIARLRRAVETIMGDVSGEGGAEGLSIVRQMTQGRKSTLAKAIGMAGLPVNVVAVVKSSLKGSVYQNILADVRKLGYTEQDLLAGNLWATSEGDIHCIRARSPLLFVHMLRVVVIRPGKFMIQLPEGKVDLYKVCSNPWVMFVNPVVAGIDAGDWDGDGNSLTFVEKEFNHIPLTTVLDCTNAIKYRTGKEATARTQGSYFKDHYFPKEVKPSDFTTKKAVSAKNLLPMTWTFDSQGNVVKAARGAKRICEESAITYTNRVGAMYMLFNIAELMVNLQSTLNFSLPTMSWLNDGTLVFSAGELYEAGPLGGLSWDNNVTVDFLTSVMFGGVNVKKDGVGVAQYLRDIEKTDFNALGSRPNAYLMAAAHIADTKQIITAKDMTAEVLIGRSYSKEELIGIVSILNFWFTKGQLDFNKSNRRKFAIAYLGLSNSFDMEELGEKNVVIKFLNYAVPSALTSFKFHINEEGEGISRDHLLGTLGLDLTVDLDVNSFIVS